MRRAARRRAKIGDVLAVELKDGFAYIQFVGKQPERGDILRAFPTIFRKPLTEISSLQEQCEAHCFLSRASILLEDPRFTWSGTLRAPEQYSNGVSFRTAIDDGDWYVNTSTKTLHVGALTPELARLPLDALYPARSVVQWFEIGWLPEQDQGSFITAATDSKQPAKASATCTMVLGSFRDLASARTAYDELRNALLPLYLLACEGGTYDVNIKRPLNASVSEYALEAILRNAGAADVRVTHASIS